MNHSVKTGGNLETLIHSYYPAMTRSEQKVADFVLRHLDQIVYHSVTELSEEADVGETTVLRFCRKIGMKGYQEFKLTLAKDLANRQDHEGRENVSTGFMEEICNNTIGSIRNTFSMIDEKALATAIQKLDTARSVHFFGVGTSGLTALDAKNRFIRIGKHVDAVTDSHFQSMTAATLSDKDVVVGISVSGSTHDTLNSLKIAKENGAFVIAITYYLRSPITKLADIVLPGGEKESPLEGGSLAAKISQLYVIDLLCTGLALEHIDESIKMKEKTARSVVNKIY
jgi:DNA-binding MurR/RpiR family transcriptional regulator